MRKVTSVLLALTMTIVFTFAGCALAANGTLTARDSSGKTLGQKFSVREDAAIEFVVTWDATVAEKIDCVYFVRSDDNVCVFGPCWSADQSPDYGWHNGHGDGTGTGGGHHGNGYGNGTGSGNGSGYGSEWHHNQCISRDVFCPASGDHCIIARGYCTPVAYDSQGNPTGDPIGVSTPLYMTVTTADSPSTDNNQGNGGGSGSSGGGGGGCAAGFLGVALLIVVPMFMRRA